MQLSDIRLPSVDKSALSNDQKLQQVLEYMMQLNKKLQFVLQNLDEDNLSTEMARTVTEMKAAAAEIEHTVRDEEFSSYVKQTARELAARVQKDEVIASVNMSPEEIRISAPKISLEGLVTVNGYFRVNEDGAMEATGGKIAGWTIGRGALYTGQNTAAIAPALYLGTENLLKATAIAGSAARKDWRVKIAANYGVTGDGSLYAENGYFRGSVEAGKIKYSVDESGRDAGTFNGGGITIHSIYHTSVAPNTLTQDEMEQAYQTLKANVATYGRMLSGSASITRLSCSAFSAETANVSEGLTVSGRTLGFTTMTDGSGRSQKVVVWW